jgi:hypothetical protein
MENAKSTTDYPYRVVYPSQALLTERGFGRVARLPFIMDSRPGYHRLANQFLIDLGLTGCGNTQQPSPRPSGVMRYQRSTSTT